MKLATAALGGQAASGRLLLLVSLALNLFFVGIVGALAIKHYIAPIPGPAVIDRTAAGRINRLAATLPESDARILRENFRANSTDVEAAQYAYRQAQDVVRAALRADPFDIGRLRLAMGQTRAARQKFDESLQNLLALAAAQMSAAGRNKLADWPPHRQPSTPPKTQ
ncbi:MAG: periplasmic heavy metal sensor [Variibacter sp.]